MDGGAWWATVHRVAKSRTRLSDFTFTFKMGNREKRHDLGDRERKNPAIENWHWWAYLQGRNGDVDIMNMWTQWVKKRVGQSEGVALAYTLPCVSRRLVGRCCGPQVALLDGLWWPRGVEWGGWKEAREGGIYLYTLRADSHCYAAKT